jgi:hypothetical protein
VFAESNTQSREGFLLEISACRCMYKLRVFASWSSRGAAEAPVVLTRPDLTAEKARRCGRQCMHHGSNTIAILRILQVFTHVHPKHDRICIQLLDIACRLKVTTLLLWAATATSAGLLEQQPGLSGCLASGALLTTSSPGMGPGGSRVCTRRGTHTRRQHLEAEASRTIPYRRYQQHMRRKPTCLQQQTSRAKGNKC